MDERADTLRVSGPTRVRDTLSPTASGRVLVAAWAMLDSSHAARTPHRARLPRVVPCVSLKLAGLCVGVVRGLEEGGLYIPQRGGYLCWRRVSKYRYCGLGVAMAQSGEVCRQRSKALGQHAELCAARAADTRSHSKQCVSVPELLYRAEYDTMAPRLLITVVIMHLMCSFSCKHCGCCGKCIVNLSYPAGVSEKRTSPRHFCAGLFFRPATIMHLISCFKL